MDNNDQLFPVVGVAASAGGLEAFTQLLRHLSTNTGMAFVLIQHLSPDHKSLLTEILAKATQMPVSEVQDGMAIEPNHVYIIPPNTKMILSQGMLQLAPREKVEGKYMPGDAFFTSVAAERGPKAIAVVLSGADGDGSLGLTEIKAAGGVTFAQCEGTAKFDSMPNTAVATGNVDFVLPPEKIAEELANLSRYHFIAHPPSNPVENPPESEEALPVIFALLRSATGVDFSRYKLTMIARRMQRRMLLYKLEQLADYAQYLQDNPAEVKALYEEILIHVTSFFRDPEAFQQLKAQVFPTITQNKSAESPVRIWVAGCSTGEEVYSIAICLLEFFRERATRLPIQIFATDISEASIDKARSGIYQENQMVDVSPERRHSFFRPLAQGGYQISKAVRELCVFARQDLGSDPPFSNLDLVSCRNVLIYLGEALQKRVMAVFHYSLNPAGFLWLGTSESTNQFSDLFTLVDKKSKIYAKKLTAARPIFSFNGSSYSRPKAGEPRQITQVPAADFDLQKETDQLILNRYAPVGVVTNDEMDVLQLRGETDSYLRLSPGTPSFNLFKMVREDLLAGLRAAVYQAQQQDVVVRTEGLRVAEDEQSRIVNLEVIPFKGALEDRYFLVLFEASLPTSNPSPVNPENLEPGDLEREIVRLRQELATANQERAAAQEYLQAVIQEQEGTNQELRVANEEILSSNEELQSTNEELETAKEEIQATNEELNTTNEELQTRNLESNRVNSDLTNLLAGINIPILMLTHDLRVRRFTPTAQKLFNFIPTDVGRPFSDIRANLNLPELEPLILEVIDTLSPKQLEVQTQAGYWYNLRIRPYRTIDNRIDGAVVVLVDIDALKRSTVQLEAARNYAEAIVETVREPLVVLDNNLQVMTANRAFYQVFRVLSVETEHRLVFDLGNGQWDTPQLRSLLEEMLSNNTYLEDFEVEYNLEQIGRRTMLLSARRMPSPDNETQMILLGITDITERKQSEAERTQLLTQEQGARAEAEAANRTKDEFLSIISHELRNPLNSMLGWSQLLRNRKFDPAKTARALEIIEQSARLQAKLIEDLLDISRITTGKLQLNASQIDLAPVIEAATNIARLSAEANNIHIETLLNLERVEVSGDPDRLQQVIWNLLSNAIKFTPAGGRVTVKLERVNSLAQIQVCDTGQGISADFLPYIFDRFRQADGSSTRAQSGLGLGLAIVRYLVELHGGTVHAASPGAGQGTTITVRLPLSAKPAENSRLRALEQVSTVGLEVQLNSPPTLDGLRVLVVDDETGILELLTIILEQYGAQVTAVASGEEAIAVLTANPGEHDVLLSDIGMPHEDGYTLIRQVRALGAESGGQIPAAALTAYVRVEEQRESLAAGFQRHIAKPVEPAQLVLIVAELAGLARGN